jgi:pSer/pThr/pTyr-binding forkhead associated (FHA) protein
MVHLIKPDETKTQFVMGRGHDSDMRVSDISVSRCHAMIKYNAESKSFLLEDNLSKFGTLILAHDPFDLNINHTTAIQIGRSVISFTVKPSQPPAQI